MGALTTEEVASLYRQYAGMVYQISRMLLKNAPDAEDALQTVFRKTMEREEPFASPEHARAWLIVTARNECRDQLKHWWRRQREDESSLDTLAWEQPEDGLVWEQVAALPEKHRLVLYLHYYQGYATDEIAQILRQNPSTVRSWLLRARKKLKLRLEAEGYGS